MDLVQVIKYIIVAAAVGILLVFLNVAGIALPGWLWQIAWIVLAAIVCLLAIKIIRSLM